MRHRATLVGALLLSMFTAGVHAQTAEVRVTDPRRDDRIGREMTVKGTVTKPPGHHVWVVARRHDFAPLFWPQREANLEGDGRTWSATAAFGGPQDVGWEFDVGAIVVDGTGHDRLNDYWVKAMSSGDWRPIPLPRSAAEHIVRVRKNRH